MASRLSEDSVKAVYDAGHQGLLVQDESTLQLLSTAAVDLNALLLAEDPQAAVQAVPPLALYQALKHHGVADNLDILPLMSSEQVQRSFDYEAWEADRLEPLKACQWLQLFKEVGDEEMAHRFKGLEEEFQLALLSPFIEIIDEDAFEKLGSDDQDTLHRLPCNTLYFRIKTADNRVEATLDGLVDAMLQIDINYAYSMLAHATYMPPTEQEDMAARFRRARIEEDGFVSYQESLEAFMPLDLKEARQRLGLATAAVVSQDSLVQAPTSAMPFLVAAIKHGATTWSRDEYAQVVGAYAFLANTLAAAAQIEIDDQGAMKKVLQQAQALAGLGLEHLTGGDVALAADLLKKEHPKTLFRAGLALVAVLQDEMLTALAAAGLPCAGALRKLWILQRPGALLSRLDAEVMPVLGLRRTEVLRGLFNRFPVRPESVTPTDDGAAERTIFGPITSRATLAEFAAQLAGLRGILHTAAQVGQGALLDLDRRLSTAIVRALLGDGFVCAALTDAALLRFVDLPQSAAQALTGDLFTEIESGIRLALSGLERSDAAVQAAMEDLADVAMRLHMAREHDKKSVGTTAALSALVDKEILH